jgi:hypothetical protein
MTPKKKKRRKKPEMLAFKYRLQFLMSFEMARKLDIENGNTLWEDALISSMKNVLL